MDITRCKYGTALSRGDPWAHSDNGDSYQFHGVGRTHLKSIFSKRRPIPINKNKAVAMNTASQMKAASVMKALKMKLAAKDRRQSEGIN